MKKVFLYIVLLSSVISLNVYSQVTYNKTITLAGAPSGGIYVARDWVKLNTGTYNYSTYPFEAKIDESLLYDADYQTYVEPEARVWTASLPVGTTPAAFNVTPGGAAVYSVPIQVAPGSNRMQPNISVTYNSQGGNGLLGIGWNLSGISAITRTGQSKYYDNATTEVKLTTQDRFLLDGQRIVVEGPVSYGASDQVHYPEVYDFSSIIPKETSGTGPKYFIVEKKDGTKIYYGDYDSTNAFLKSSFSATTIAWYIAKIVDRRGNYMRFIYSQNESDGETWLTSIEYTGNDALDIDPYNKVEFNYQNRTDISISYVAGCKLTHKKIIRKISSYCEGQLVRAYMPKYYFDVTTKLNEIEEYNSGGERYNSIVAGYGQKITSPSWLLGPWVSGDQGREMYFGFADFNGDGVTDFIKCRKTDELLLKNFTWEVWIVENGVFVKKQTGTWNFTDVKGFKFTPGDFNNDGLTDLIICVDKEYGASSMVYCFESVGDSLSCASSDYFPGASENNFFAGDLDSDGIPELINITSTAVETFKFSITDLTIPPVFHTLSLNLTNSLNYISYFNGDPKPDLISIKSTGITVYQLNLTTYSSIFYSSLITTNNTTRFYTGNFNNDQNLDILTWSSTANWKLYQNKGNALVESTAPALPNIDMEASATDHNLFVNDFNNDGKTDLVFAYRNGNKSNLYYHYSTGDGFTEQSVLDGTGWLYTNKPYIQVFSDFNGDGYQDLFCKIPDDGTVAALLDTPNDKSRFVEKIVSGTKLLTSISYTSISTPNNGIYTKGTGSTYPIIDFQGPIYVVASAVQSAGGQTISDNSYAYEAAKIHKLGKGFLGFSKFIAQNNLTGFKSTTNYLIKIISGKYYFTYPYLVSVFHGSTQVSTKYSLVDLKEYPNGLRFFPYPVSGYDQNYIEDTKVTTTFDTYDDYGNPTKITQEFIADDHAAQGHGAVEAVITTTATYGPEPLPYLPFSVTVLSHRDGQADNERTTNFTYTDTHLPDIVTSDPGTAFEVREDNDYDGCGNLTVKKITDKLSTELRKITYGYDAKKRFVVSTTNALGHSSVSSVDPKTGNILSTTNAQNITVYNTYDLFGRPTGSSGPDGPTEVKYAWSSDSHINNDLYSIQTINPDNSYLVAYFDAFGRKVHEKTSPVFTTNEIHKSISYNTKGQIESVSEPYDNLNDKKLVNYSYNDDFGRLTGITSYRQDIAYSYPEPRKSVVTNNLSTARTSWKKTNSLGEVVHAHDQGGDLFYRYNATGQVDTIEAPGDLFTVMDYDPVGRQISITDPSAGTIRYEYHLLGQLTKQTDAKGNVYTMTYDNLGRIKTRSNSTEGTTTYSYVTAGNGLGMLASVNNPTSGISNSYTYGDYSRVETVTESIDDDDYEFTYTYDELGRVSQLEYPGDFSIRYGYGNYGELKKVTDAGNQLIWEVKDVTSHGELEKIVYGNGLSTDLDYDDYHQLTDILTTNASGDKRQHLQYSFQYQTGNLLSRTDKLLSTSGITETFTYDNLDRLTSYKVGSNPAHAIAYNTDGTGRYISKTGLGVYHYGEDNAPELALTSVTGSDGTVINQAQQDISYTPFNKVERITQGTKQLEITYGIDQQRKITKLYDGTTLIKKKTFVGGLYEIEEDQAGNKRHLYYVSGPTGEAAIFVKINTGAPAPYYIHKDHQGTYQTITNASGSTVETLSFDPWGRRRNATDWTYSGIPASFTFNRGYTGHEHLDEFGLINMNGRVYDPLAGAFLSPDNFVQSPGSTQSYNRYGYCLNNPLKYSDPSGEFIRLGVIGFWAPFYILDNYLKGEQDAFMSGIRDATSAANEAFNSFQVPIYNNDNVTVTAGLDIWNFGVSVNTYYHNGDWSGGIGVGVGVFGGFNYHANGGLSYSPDDDVTISAGAGVGSNHWGWNASVKYNGYGVGYGQTYYGNAIGPDGLPNNQTVGTFSLFFNNNSLTIQNDFLGDKHDRWRSNAVELTIGNFAIGTWLYNNDPASEGKGFDLFGTNRQGKMNRPVNGNQRFGTWNNGKVYQSPIYFGIRSGNTVDRIGYSSPWVQEYTQNTVHRWVPFGRQNFYTEDSDFRYGLYLYAGYHNPFSLWQTINW